MHILTRVASAFLLCGLLASCGGATSAPAATEAPTSAPAATAEPAATAPPAAVTPPPASDGTLSVAEVSGYKDSIGSLYIVGRVANGTDRALTAVQLQARASTRRGRICWRRPTTRRCSRR